MGVAHRDPLSAVFVRVIQALVCLTLCLCLLALQEINLLKRLTNKKTVVQYIDSEIDNVANTIHVVMEFGNLIDSHHSHTHSRTHAMMQPRIHPLV